MSVPAIRCLTAVLLTALVSAPSAATSLASDERGMLGGEPGAWGGLSWMPGGDPTEGVRPVTGPENVVPAIPWIDLPCLDSDQDDPRGHKLPRVISWLYRWVRGFDIERSTTPAPLLYLRSPFLSGFSEPVGCPGDRARAERPPTCVAVTTSDGHEYLATSLVSLPQLGARTPGELASALRERLDKGELVLLRTLGGQVVKVDPRKAVELDVRACESEIV